MHAGGLWYSTIQYSTVQYLPQAASLEDLLSLNTDFFFFPPAAVLDGVALTQLPEQAVAEGKLNAREVLL